jgi:hypothetical protein
MKYTIAFRDLPFEPEFRQVIYVENQYDERTNKIIKENYDQLKWLFKRANLELIYLPMFFNDEETRERVLYYAPYLTSEIIEKAELRSSHLLGYMSHLENKEKIVPSLLFAPHKNEEEWIFEGISIDFEPSKPIDSLQILEDIISDIEDEYNPAELYSPLRTITEEPFIDATEESCSKPSKVEYSSSGLWDKFKKGALKFGKCIVEEEDETSDTQLDRLDDIQEEDIMNTFEEFERNIKRLRLLGIPLDAILEFVAKYETISRLYITDDLRIFLPDYNNKEVLMPALHKAVYLLFLFNSKKGIVLKRLEEHHSELLYLYRKTCKKQELTPKQLESIKKLETSYDGIEAIYPVMSKIRVAFKNVIDEHLAQHYYIIGKPGEPYKVALDESLIKWEEDE